MVRADYWWSRVLAMVATALLVGGFFWVGHVTGAVSNRSNTVPPLAGDLLRGRTIILDPGHGGFDPGARGLKTSESEINLAVALRLRTWLEMAGAHVLMTWSSPRDIPSNRKYRVRARMDWINRQRADLLIDIHCNSGAPSYHGPQTFYWDGSASYHLAHDVQEELQYYSGTHREVKRIDQYVLRYARMPAINVEIGFITNAHEENKLMNADYQTDLTWYIFIGTERFLVKGRWPAQLLQTPPPIDLLIRD